MWLFKVNSALGKGVTWTGRTTKLPALSFQIILWFVWGHCTWAYQLQIIERYDFCRSSSSFLGTEPVEHAKFCRWNFKPNITCHEIHPRYLQGTEQSAFNCYSLLFCCWVGVCLDGQVAQHAESSHLQIQSNYCIFLNKRAWLNKCAPNFWIYLAISRELLNRSQ